MVEKSEQATVETAELNAEIRKLKARVAELQDVGAKDDSPISEDTRERLRDLPDQGRDQAGRLLRGLAYAGVESLRSTADSLVVGIDELVGRMDKRKAEATKSRKQESSVIAAEFDDVVAAVATGLDRALEGPSRVIDRFIDEYRRPDAKGRKTAKA